MKSIKQFFAVLALVFTTQVIAAPGPGYTKLNPEQPTRSGNKIEVLQFFFYGCSHCYNLHPALTAMEKNLPKDVELIYVPTIFSANMEPMARTFFALESIGELHRVHDSLFQAWHVQMVDLRDQEKILGFVTKQGVDAKKFGDAYNSFSTQSKVARVRQMTMSYGIRGTPTITVDGKYTITGLGPKETMRVLDEVISKVRKERARGI